MVIPRKEPAGTGEAFLCFPIMQEMRQQKVNTYLWDLL